MTILVKKQKRIKSSESIFNQKKINHIFHYSDKFETILKIIRNGFTPSYCDEKIGNFEYYFPMVSFCNIPIRDVDLYMRYGKYGIGMSLNWAIKNSISPVIYIHENTPFKYFHSEINKLQINVLINKRIIGGLNKKIENIEDETNYDELEYILKETNNKTVPMLQFFKNWKTVYNQNEVITYQEREWRYIPNVEESKYKRIITIQDEEFAQLRSKTYKPKPHLPEYSLNIEDIESIKYILINTEKQREKILDILIKKFGKDKVTTAILTGNLLIIKDDIIKNDF